MTEKASPQSTEENDRTPISRTVIILMVLAVLVMFVDGSDMSAMPLAVPYILAEWGGSADQFGLALSAMPLGFGIGALLLGPLGDRYGRRLLIIGSMALVAAAMLASATATNTLHFEIWRLLTGIGLGACLTNLNALVAELVPDRMRARLITIMSCGIPIGSAAAGFFMPPAIGVGGWEGAFLMVGAGIVLLTAALFAWLPESRAVKTQKSVDAQDSEHMSLLDRLLTVLKPLSRDYRLITFVFVGLYTMNALSLFMLSAWLPTVLSQADFSADMASRLSGVMQIGGLIGGLTIAYFVDRSASVPALVVSYILVALALVGFSFFPQTWLGWGFLLLIVGGGISGAHLAIMALGTFFYPSIMLASALGLAVAMARIGAVAGPLLGQFLVQDGGGSGLFFLALLVPVGVCIGCVAMLPLVEKRRVALGLA